MEALIPANNSVFVCPEHGWEMRSYTHAGLDSINDQDFWQHIALFQKGSPSFFCKQEDTSDYFDRLRAYLIQASNTEGTAHLELGGILDIEGETQEALVCYKKAAEKNLPYAFVNLGYFWEKKADLTEEESEKTKYLGLAEDLYQQEAKDEHSPLGPLALGDFYMKKAALVQEKEEKARYLQMAEEQYQKVVEKDELGSHTGLGMVYEKKAAIATAKEEQATYLRLAERWLLAAAQKGFPSTQCLLGLFYENYGNYTSAEFWYRKAAAIKYPKAQFALGCLYKKMAQKTAKKEQKLYYERLDLWWLKKAWRSGYLHALNSLGCFYASQITEEILSKKKKIAYLRLAEKWFKMACLHRSKKARINLRQLRSIKLSLLQAKTKERRICHVGHSALFIHLRKMYTFQKVLSPLT